LEGAISKISAENFQAISVTHDGLFYVQRRRLADLALERRVPTIAFASEQWQAGMLATYGPNVPTLYRRAGAFIDRILKGANPADLPVEHPRNLSSSSTSTPQRRLALRSLPHCSPAPTE
jgi:putative ABC transport system substrate-binding protein